MRTQRHLSVLVLALCAMNSGAEVSAGFLFAAGTNNAVLGSNNRNGHISGLDVVHFPMPTAPVFQPDLVRQTGSAAPYGESRLHAGMYSEVLPAVAYIAINNDSKFEVTPGPASMPGQANHRALATFEGLRQMNYYPGRFFFPGAEDLGILLISQYLLTGYLAPGTSLQVVTSAEASLGGVRYANLNSHRTYSSSGAFSLDYDAYAPLQGFHLNTIGSYDLRYKMSLEFIAAPGAASSWVTLDPGVGSTTDGSVFYPWAPAQTVPEPSSLIHIGIGAAFGIAVTARRRRQAS